ncbi:MAG: endonuclease [Bdellovibrionaceae bacterium]|nr:endonuclease [Pseudobdellovibrionaceae bacterium]
MILKARLTARWMLIVATCFTVFWPDLASADTQTRRPYRPSRSARFVAAPETVPYYGEQFYQIVRRGTRDEQLKQLVRLVLESAHVPRPGGFDAVLKSCPQSEQTRGCYGHRPLDYDAARVALMTELYGTRDGRVHVVRDVYCERDYTAMGFRGESTRSINTEHTWPQSRFTGRYPSSMQKSDLHHLFPTDSEMNSIRGNFKFAEVDRPVKALKCPIAKFGHIDGHSEYYFEPPVNHKGNVARALFYFSVRYQISIDSDEEEFLRQWNRMDPVDEPEFTRNEQIMKLQGNRNPFVDHPELADRIGDF